MWFADEMKSAICPRAFGRRSSDAATLRRSVEFQARRSHKRRGDGERVSGATAAKARIRQLRRRTSVRGGEGCVARERCVRWERSWSRERGAPVYRRANQDAAVRFGSVHETRPAVSAGLSRACRAESNARRSAGAVLGWRNREALGPGPYLERRSVLPSARAGAVSFFRS